MLRSRVFGQLAFQFSYFRAHDVLAVVEHAMDVAFKLRTDAMLLRCQIRERDGLISALPSRQAPFDNLLGVSRRQRRMLQKPFIARDNQGIG